MKRKWIRWVCWILLTPILLFVILMVLLYIPPIQNLLRREATAYASKATGMQIQVDRIDLRFPLNLLVRGVEVVQHPDTLLTLESLNVHVQALPLLKGKVEVDGFTLKNAKVNSVNLLDGMKIKGNLGYFFLASHGVDLSDETALIDNVELSNTQINLILNDTTTVEDTTASAPFNWNLRLQKLKLKNVTFGMELPADSMKLAAYIDNAVIDEGNADFRKQYYGLKKILLSGATANYDVGGSKPGEGFDASHIAVRNVTIGLDSLLYKGRDINAIFREVSMEERSGLSITSLTGHLTANDSIISVPDLRLLTPHSEINFNGQTYWELVNIPTTGRLAARLDAYLGKEDVLLFTGDLPQSFKDAYPFRPIVIHAGTDGNLKELQISRLSVDLPGAFSIKGGGVMENLTDSLKRSGSVDFGMVTQNLNFLTGLTGLAPDSSFVIPNNMTFKAKLSMKGPQYTAVVDMNEGTGKLALNAALNSTTEVYKADIKVNDLQVHHFLPRDSIYELSMTASASGKGLDFMSNKSQAKIDLSLDKLHYASYHLSGVDLTGELKRSLVTAQLKSDNEIIKMTAEGQYNLAYSYPDGKITLDVTQLDLHELGLIPDPIKHPIVFTLTGEVEKNRVFAHFTSGDLKLNLSARTGLLPLINQSTHFVDVLMKQIDKKLLDHATLREALPTAILSFSAGKNNMLSYYLATQNISFDDISMKFGTAPDWGINGKAAIHALDIDTLLLDTVFFNVKQDTAQMNLRAGIINGPKNPQFAFSTIITGQIRDKDAELQAELKNGKGETGLLLGVRAQPLTGGGGKGDGVAFTLIPAEPIVAFRKFHFNENNNWIYIHNNMRVYANVDMWDSEGMGFRVHSIAEDTVSLQNIDVEIRRINLADVSRVIPYLPEITGMFSAEAHFIQSPEKKIQLSAEASIEKLTYESRLVGDLALGATWLPGDKGEQYINAYMNHDDVEVMVADGRLTPGADETSKMEVNATMEHFPLRVANVFVPDQLVTLSGDLDGDLHLTGTTDQPLINGKLMLDSVAVTSTQYGAKFRFDDRPVQIENSRLLFDKFSIYTTEKNPFTIDGYVDFRELSNPTAKLSMQARNYTLLDAKKTKESLVYGKIFADMKATLTGPLSSLKMRGNINLLGNTDVSYVLMDSPLTVQDRLGSLVTFTSFADTTGIVEPEAPSISLGGMDMAMTIHIDPSVLLKVDLDASNDNRVQLEGGGDLSMKYTPQGDLTLTGRYTMTGGTMKYSLPIIAAKEFAIDNGSYVEWVGNPMNPMLNFKATDRIRATVSEGENGATRMVNFDVSISVKNRLENLGFAFDVSAPEDATVQSELAGMDAEERGKQALYIMLFKTYLGTGSIGANSGGAKLNMGSALNSLLSSQINELVSNIKGANISVGIEDYDDSDVGGKRTDYSFSYSQRFFNNRFQIVIGGKVSQGGNNTNEAESFINNVSLEYRLDRTGTRYVRLFYDKNYESLLEGEITEAGVGLVLRKKLDKLSELFIFKKKKQE